MLAMAKERSTPQDDPLFRTDGGALMFALNYTHGTCKKPGLTTLMGGGGGGRGLGGLDGAAQAGMLRSELDWLRAHRKAILIARFAVPQLPCLCDRPCCRGYRENPEWVQAIGDLTEHVLMVGVAGTISHFRLRRAMVQRYFGARVSFVEMATLCKVSRNTASAQHAEVVKYLKNEERRARWEYEGILKVEGIVE